MGNNSSYELPNCELVPLTKPTAAIATNVCYEELFTLQHKSSILNGTITFCNVHTGATLFTVDHSILSGQYYTLLDSSGVAISTFYHERFSGKPIYYTKNGDANLEIYALYHKELSTKVRVAFTNLLTLEQCELGFEGNWRERKAYFWLYRGNQGVREPVAKVFCPDGVSKSKYHIAIAPHMDAALIAMVCFILDKRPSGYSDGEEDDWIEGVLDALLSP